MDKVSTSRRVFFKTKGGSFSAIFIADTGDLWQEYDGTPAAPTKFYPDFEQNPVNLNLSIASSNATGTVSPTKITYFVNGEELSFNGTVLSAPAKFKAGGASNPGTKDMFALSASGALRVTGNLVKVANGASFSIQAKAEIDGETMVAHLPVSISQHTDTSIFRVTIVPDSNYFTIDKKGGSCTLTAKAYRNGSEITSGLNYRWYKLSASGWGSSIATTSSITVNEADIDTYATYKVEVWEGAVSGEPHGSDTQGVIDTSDPYDITVNIQFGKYNGGSSWTYTATADESLDNTMNGDDCLRYRPTLIKRNDQTQVSGVTWLPGTIIIATGLSVLNVQPKTESGVTYYDIYMKDLQATGYGEFEFIFSGEK